VETSYASRPPNALGAKMPISFRPHFLPGFPLLDLLAQGGDDFEPRRAHKTSKSAGLNARPMVARVSGATSISRANIVFFIVTTGFELFRVYSVSRQPRETGSASQRRRVCRNSTGNVLRFGQCLAAPERSGCGASPSAEPSCWTLKSWTLSGVSRGWETLGAGASSPATAFPSGDKALSF